MSTSASRQASVTSNSNLSTRKPLPLIQTDLISLVKEISKTLPRPPTIASTSQPSSKNVSALSQPSSSLNVEKSSKPEASSTTSKWNTYTLGMGSYLIPTSVPTMRNIVQLPTFSIPSLSTVMNSDSTSSINVKKSESNLTRPTDVVGQEIQPNTVISSDSNEVISNLPAVIESSVIDSDALIDAISESGFESINQVLAIEEIATPIVEPLNYFCGEGNTKDTLMKVRIYKVSCVILYS